VGDDRQIALRLRAREGEFDLLLAVLGRRSNLVLLAPDERIVAVLRPLADTRPELSLGEKWRAPDSTAPAPGEDRFAAESDERLLEAIEEFYAAGECAGQRDALTRRIEQALRKGRRNLERRLEKLERDLDAARADATLERQGELFKSVLSGVRKGDERVVARDYETGTEVEIRLDPRKTPSENLAHLFKRYRKAVRTLTQAGAQPRPSRRAPTCAHCWSATRPGGKAEGRAARRSRAEIGRTGRPRAAPRECSSAVARCRPGCSRAAMRALADSRSGSAAATRATTI
jgi:predicted ribosome quality control (RQC) complex YloA/Tae2 family protein